MSRERVLQYMLRTPRQEVTIVTMSKELGISHQQISVHVRNLLAANLIEKGDPIISRDRAPTATYLTRPGVRTTTKPVRVVVPVKEKTPPKRGRRTSHLIEFLHANIERVVVQCSRP